MHILIIYLFFLNSCDPCKGNQVCLKVMTILNQVEHQYEGVSQSHNEKRAILKIGHAAGPALLFKLNNTKDMILKRAIIDWLGELRYEPSFSEIEQIATSDRNPNLRSFAVSSLYEIDPNRAEAIMAQLQKSEKEASVKIILAKVLGGYHSDSTADALKALLNDPSPWVRREAAWFLYVNQGTASIKTLQTALEKETDLAVKNRIWEIIKDQKQ